MAGGTSDFELEIWIAILEPGWICSEFAHVTHTSSHFDPQTRDSAPLVSYGLKPQSSGMSQSAHQGLEGRNDLVMNGRPLSSDNSGRSSPYAESMAAEDEERIHKMYKRMVVDLRGSIAFSALLSVVTTIGFSMSNRYQRPDSINPNVTHAAATLLDSPDAELLLFSPPEYYTIWPIPHRFLSLAVALISMVYVGLSLQRPEGHPILGDAWYQVILCLYFVALHKLLLDVDFGLFITTFWWIGFLWASWRYVARSRVATRNIRAVLNML